MDKNILNSLKEDKNVKFIYKLPCSFGEEGFEYIIIGDTLFSADNVRIFSIEEWFDRIDSGSLLPYVCSRLSKKYKIKEYLNIYKRPDLLKLRKFISGNIGAHQIFQECVGGLQIINEMKVNRPDVYKEMEFDYNKARMEFYKAIDPMFKKSLDG